MRHNGGDMVVTPGPFCRKFMRMKGDHVSPHANDSIRRAGASKNAKISEGSRGPRWSLEMCQAPPKETQSTQRDQETNYEHCVIFPSRLTKNNNLIYFVCLLNISIHWKMHFFFCLWVIFCLSAHLQAFVRAQYSIILFLFLRFFFFAQFLYWVQTGLELVIDLSQPPECWDYLCG